MGNAIPLLDLMFLLMESHEQPKHVGAVLVFDKARGGDRVVREIIRAHRRARPVPPFDRVPELRWPRPEWRRVERIDPDHHVHHLSLPAPGSLEQLHRLLADLHSPMLERSRPGWQTYVIDGLAGDRFAVYSKVHHSIVDGESGMALIRNSLSTDPQERRIRPVVTITLPKAKARAKPAVEAQSEDAVAKLLRKLVPASRGWMRVAEEALSGLLGHAHEERRPYTAPATPMNEPIANSRAITHMILPVARMKAVAKAWETTLNDVALCVLDHGIHAYLRDREHKAQRPLVAIVPVSLHDATHKEVSTRASVIWTPLGEVGAPVTRRMKDVIANVRVAKEQMRTLGKDAAYAYAVAAFAVSEATALPLLAPLGMRIGNMLVSNVRGPEEPLYCGGAKLTAIYPLSVLAVGVGLNATLMSYDGNVNFGFTANGVAMPGIDGIARHTERAFEELERRSPRKPARQVRSAGSASGPVARASAARPPRTARTRRSRAPSR